MAWNNLGNLSFQVQHSQFLNVRTEVLLPYTFISNRIILDARIVNPSKNYFYCGWINKILNIENERTFLESRKFLLRRNFYNFVYDTPYEIIIEIPKTILGTLEIEIFEDI